MNSRIYWKIALVLCLIAWSLTEMWPPTNRDMITVFEEQASNKDETFNRIVAGARELQSQTSKKGFASLFEATGTNDLTQYFPNVKISAVKNPNRTILQKVQRDAAGQIQLGIDLQGGTYFVVGMDQTAYEENLGELEKELAMATNANQRASIRRELDEAQDRGRILTEAIAVLRKRVDKLGVAEPIIQPLGEDRIVIQLPGLSESNLQEARENIRQAAFLEFRMVHQESQSLLEDGLIPPGYEVLKQEDTDEQGRTTVTRYVVKKRAERGLTGKYVKNAFVSSDPLSNRPQIHVNFTLEGGKLFADVTKEHVGHLMAIVLDGELYSAPVIREAITQGSCSISGDYSRAEAFQLASILENPLEAPLEIYEQRSVDPSLGADSIRSGYQATLIGLGAVIVFMLIYYLLAGLVANVALMLNILLLFGVLCSIDATLTLPGIAGILLTVGMAVDANVLIFERIREEMNSGKSLRGSLASGYGKAFGTILDANLTTLIASIILIFLGTGPVKGFGVTLTIGICASMFTALVVTRLVFDILLAKGLLKTIPMLQLPFLHNSKWDFLKVAKPAFAISWILVIIGIGTGLKRGENALGVDFRGGDAVTYSFTEKLGTDELRDAITSAVPDAGEPQIQYQTSLVETGHETVQILTGYGTGEAVKGAILQAFPDAGFTVMQIDTVGPTIGREILGSALVAVLLAMFGILVYVAFRYEFSFAIGAIVAIVHDVLMTLGWFFLTGGELSAPMVAAVLTIIGFSINDTIVIFDRIREDLRLGLKGSFKDVINHALNQTLNRTLITSGTTLMAAGSLYIFGGGVINDFAFTFVVGIVTGTYSSIYIAAATVLWWHKGNKPSAAPQVFAENPVVVPGA